jgi:hypothetical protein
MLVDLLFAHPFYNLITISEKLGTKRLTSPLKGGGRLEIGAHK